MYSLRFEMINGTSLEMNADTNINITTISGLSAVETDWDTYPAGDGAGEIAVNPRVKGKTITINGYVLDGDRATKNALINTFYPKAQGTLFVKLSSTVWRSIDVVVTRSPELSQETHSKFVISLYAPVPYWKASETLRSMPYNTWRSITVGGVADATWSIAGNVASGSVDKIIVSYNRGLKTLTLNFSPAMTAEGFFEFRKYDDRVAFSAMSGNNTYGIECVDISSTLWRMPAGTADVRISATGTDPVLDDLEMSTVALYSGVIVDGA